MKKVLILLLSVGVILVACKKDEEPAPVPTVFSITVDDLGSAGAVYRIGVDSTNLGSFVLDTAGGQNKTWDFSTVGSDRVDTIRFLAPSSTPGGALYGANLAIQPENNEPIYIYLNKATDRVEQVGLWVVQDMGGTLDTLTAAFSDNQIFMKFPYTFGATFTDNGLVTLYTTMDQGGTTVYVKSDMTTSTRSEIDASGTITTPLGQFQCLREYKRDISMQTVYTRYSSLTPWVQLMQNADTNYSYIFFAKGKGYSVLEVDVTKTGAIKEISHLLQ